MIRGKIVGLFSLLALLACDKKVTNQTPDSVTIKVAHSQEIANFMESTTRLFALTKPVLAGGISVKVSLVNDSALGLANDIASGALKTDGWMAASSALVDYANARRTNLGPQQIECKQLFASPVVAAAQESSRYKLNPTGNTFSWKEFFSARSENNTKYSTSFLHLAPSNGTSGIASLMQLAYLSAVGPGEVINLESIGSKAALSNFSSFESYVGQYPSSDSSMLSLLANFPSEKVAFALTTEHQLIQFNRKRPTNVEKLVALYPLEGSYWDNYNLCISDTDWVSPAHRAALSKFSEFLATAQMQLLAKQEGFRPYVVNVAETGPITKEFGADPELPSLSLNPAPGDVVDFVLKQWPNLIRPSATMLVLDTSGSMEGALAYGQEKFRNWLASTSPRDLKGLISFASDVRTNQELTAEATKVIRAVDQLKSIGGSAIYDSVKRAAELLAAQELRPYRKNLVLFTDGGDKNSQISIDLLADFIHHKVISDNISIFIIALTQQNSDFSDLKRIAKESGGIFKEAYLSDMEPLFQEIMALL